MIEPLPQDVDFLAHFGVKGQQWGVRRDKVSGVSAKTNREANKDAVEFARAKMFFGIGAGTRRKLIKISVEAKSARDPNYKKAFDHHLAKQNLSVHATKALNERNRTDRKDNAKKSAGFIARKLTGEMGTTAAFTAAAVAGAAFLNSPSGRRALTKAVTTVKIYANSGKGRQTTQYVSDFFKNQGL